MAEAVTGVTWSQFLGALGALALILGLFEKTKKVFGAKEKREVSFAEEFATKAEFEKEKEYGAARREAIYAMIKEGREHTDTKIDAFRKEVKEDIDGVHGRVSEAVECLGELRGEVRAALNRKQ